ncbi:MAG: VCBS repeat-containing protein [Verrucomicrobia bacterium]|nr:VCBS repeat-containing protein [Verrucomicrobiota bacterium]
MKAARTATLSRALIAGAMILLVMGDLAFGADKNGVSPNSISLPKGPGSIEGLGESFQPSLNTGTAKYGLGLKLPPGTAGHQPSLSLSYEGGGGNGPLGSGWSISQPSIQRRTDKGIPTYGVHLGVARPDTFINEMREELVPQPNGFFFCENEGVFVRYQRVGDHWEGTAPNGTRLEFGLTANGRLQDSANNHVFSWLLERETDTRGNMIEYVYRSFPGDENRNQKYLALIRYGPGGAPWTHFHFAAFEYEDRSDWFEDGRAGFFVRTGKRLKRINIGSQGVPLPGHLAGDFDGDGTTDYLNRRYELDYLDYAGTNSHWSLLEKVTLVGADGITALPPATFDYAVSNPPDVIDASSNVWSAVNEPTAVMDNELVELVDLNADGLPDVLKTESGGGVHTVWVNQGPVQQPGGWAIQWAAPVDVDPGNGTAWNFDLASERTHLADMDGDGLADLVHQSAVDSLFFFANRGQLAWSARQDMSLEGAVPPAPFGNAGVKTADVDFDKRMDIIQSLDLGGGVGYRIWFNRGNQSYSLPFTMEPDGGFDFTLPGVQIADCNGDRVPDVARIRPGAVEVAAGLGYGRFAPPVSLVLRDFTLDAVQIANAKFTDINGDGLADLVIERAAPGQCWYWLNLGNYTLSGRKIITGLPVVSSAAAVRWADLNGNGTTDLIYSDSQATPRLQMVELGELVSGGLTPNVLTRIDNGIGMTTRIEYAPSTRFALEDAAAGNPWPDALPFPVTVVAGVAVSDSLGHEYRIQFRYHDGFYDSAEKQFRGFARVEQVDVGDSTAPTLVSRSHFDTGRDYDAMKGRLLRSTAETEDGRVFWNEITTWADPPRALMVGTNGLVVRFAHPVASAKDILELGQGTPRRLESESQYDDYGNQTGMTNYGIVLDGDRTAFDDERVTVTEYALNLEKWILRLPKRQVVQDENGAVISRSELFYDDETFSGNNLGNVTIGNLTLRRDWIDPVNPTNFVASGRTKYNAFGNPVALLDPLSNGTGNSARGHFRELGYDDAFHTYPVRETIHIGGGSPALVFEAGHDPGLATVTNSTDFNSNVIAYGYDSLGRLTSLVRPGDTAQFPTAEYAYALAVPVGTNGVVNYVETRQLDREAGSAGAKHEHYFISRQFVDGLGRSLMTRTEAEPAAGSTSPRVVVSGAVLFNARQQPVRALNPFFTLPAGSLDDLLAFENIEAPHWQGQFHDEGSLVPLNLASAHQSWTGYDAMLRVIRATNPDGTFARTEFEPLVTRAFDANDADAASPHFNTPVAQFSDGLGRMIRVDEIVRLNDDGTPAASTNTWTTRYEYDLNDRLTRITDSQNNVKLMQYDGLQRKTWMNDPNAGVSTNVHDAASNLIETTDAKGQRITYTYDGANRILSEDYHDEDSPEFSYHRTPDVSYHYDAPPGPVDQGDGTSATAQNTKGTLAWVADTSGEEHTSFDARGRVAWTVKRVPDPQLGSLSPVEDVLVAYKTTFEYDSLDRARRMVYPDNDEVTYRYNERNLLEGITGGPSGHILADVAYLPSAQQEQIEYGNGVRTRYDYDSRMRLSQLFSRHVVSNAELVHFGYDLDPVSNIRTIHDQRPTADMPLSDRRRNSQTFDYDNLYRLTRVRYNLPNPATINGGEINYRYDRIGNMLSQTSDISHFEKGFSVTILGTMAYGGTAGPIGRIGRNPGDPPGPHALTSVSQLSTNNPQPRLYPYDANGNMTEIDGLHCTWDFRDRLVAVEDDTMRAEYRYDFTGRRIIKKVFWKQGEPTPGGQPATTNSPPATTSVLYPGKHFEVRDHDQPVKYVFSGSTRVARITGSLSANTRIQRLRLHSGWNLCSVAVSGFPLPRREEGQGEVVTAAYRWNQPDQNWLPVSTNELLAAGSVLWIKAATNATLSLVGSYQDPINRPIQIGASFLSSAGFEALPLQGESAGVRADVEMSVFTASTRLWQLHLPAIPFADPGFPAFLAPGQAIFLNADAASELRVPDAVQRIRYYHQDHLGSSSATADANGVLVEETAFYPFGSMRHEHRLRQIEESYKFTQKERDRETGLHYFEARYLGGSLARFLSADPKYLHPDKLSGDDFNSFAARPQIANLYAYVTSNPLKYADPTGLELWIPFVDDWDELDKGQTLVNLMGPVGTVAGNLANTFGGADLDTRSLLAKGVTEATGSETAGDVAELAVDLAAGGGAVWKGLAKRSAQAGQRALGWGSSKNVSSAAFAKTHEVSARAFANTGNPVALAKTANPTALANTAGRSGAGATAATSASELAAAREMSDRLGRIAAWNSHVVSQIKARAGEMNALYLKTGSNMKIYDDIITKADAIFPRY